MRRARLTLTTMTQEHELLAESANYPDGALLAPERQLALARAWLAACGDTVTQARRVTVLRPVVSARVPRHDVSIPE